MAVYKGREVTLLGKANGIEESPLYTIQHKDGSREDVRLQHLQLTDAEVKEAGKSAVDHLEYAQTIKEKDLKDLRDKQDKAKIEASQGKK